MNDEDHPSSLADQAAAWIPPWQRATAPAVPPAAVPDAADREPDEADDDDDVQRPETDRLSEPAGVEAFGDDEDEDDVQRPETDRLSEPAGVEAFDDDEDEDDVQRPETDRLSEPAGVEAFGDDEDEDDVQRPETDRLSEPASVEAFDDDDDEDEDDDQRPETDRLTEPADDDAFDDEDELQRPETDLLDEPVAAALATAGDDDDEAEDEDVQQPETDRLNETVDGGDDEEEDVQRPETDFATVAISGAEGAVVEAPSPGGGVGAGRTPESVDSERPANLAGALEAILLVVDEPVSSDVLAEVLSVSIDEANAALAGLAGRYTDEGRGFDLRRAAGGWRLYTRNEYASYVERFVLDGQSVRLTQAALETLAVIAYAQPVTRSRMSAIRGVNCDGVVRTLANRGLIEECGTQPDSGAFLYRTTPLFLEKLGLDSLDELPPLAPFLPDDVNGFADA